MHKFLITALLLFLTVGTAAHAQSDAFAPWNNADSTSQEMSINGRIQNNQLRPTPYQGFQPPPQQYAPAPQPSLNGTTNAQQYAPHYYAPSPYQAQRQLTTLSAQQQQPPSTIEAMYAERTIENIEQFGYDLFGIPQTQTQQTLNALSAQQQKQEQKNLPSGAVQDNFILNMGDEVEITFTGQRSERDTYTINNDGLLLIKDFPPIPAAGRSIAQLRVSLSAAAQNLHNTKAYISLSSVRQIGVLVVGHVNKPGRRNLTVFHTVLDALMESGGVKKDGSLRQIKLVRHGRSTIIDLYSLLMHGATNIDLQLRDGDRVIVPAIGPTVAVTGAVKRPAIYEILPDYRGMFHKPDLRSEKLSLNELLEYSGGVLSPGQNRFMKLGVNQTGRERVEEIHDAFTPNFGDGSILMVSKGQDKRSSTVELLGNTRNPGIYALSEVSKL